MLETGWLALGPLRNWLRAAGEEIFCRAARALLLSTDTHPDA